MEDKYSQAAAREEDYFTARLGVILTEAGLSLVGLAGIAASEIHEGGYLPIEP